MRRLSLLAGLLLLAACSTQPTAGRTPAVKPSVLPAHAVGVDGPAVRGVVRDDQGRPVAGATVHVTVELSQGERAERGVKAGFTLGLGCVDQQGCSTPSGAGFSARDGSFAVAVPRGGAASDALRVTAVDARDLARVAVAVTLPASARAGFDVGTLPVPAASPVLVGDARRRHLEPPALAGAQLGAATVSMARVTAVGVDGVVVIKDPTTDVSAGFDPRVVEDGRVILESAQTGRVAGRRGTLTTSLVVTGTAVPASRGASCTLADSLGRPLPQQPCGLTDGVLDSAWSPHDDPRCADGPCPGTAQHDHRDVVVRFSSPLRATLLVVRGCGFTCHVLLSYGGREHPLPEPDQHGADEVYVQRLPGVPVSAVHVVTATGGFLSSLREVSVFT